MADKFPRAVRSKIMAKIRAEGTAVELTLRKALLASGKRFKMHYKELPGKPDIVFTREKIAIFIDGCFWHSCRRHGHFPKSNKSYWTPKLNKNIERASKYNKELRKQGFTVIRIWEHEINENIDKCISKIEKCISSN